MKLRRVRRRGEPGAAGGLGNLVTRGTARGQGAGIGQPCTQAWALRFPRKLGVQYRVFDQTAGLLFEKADPMAVQLHGEARPVLPHARASFLSSVPAACRLRWPASDSSPPIKRCSGLRVQCVARSDGSQVVDKYIRVKSDEKKLPPLVASLAVAGIPPCQESMYAEEAMEWIRQRWPSEWSDFEGSYLTCISYLSFSYPGAVSHDRLAVASLMTTLLLTLDDLLFDYKPTDGAINDKLQKLGIDHNLFENPPRIKQYLRGLDAIFRQEEPLHHPTGPLEAMIWQLGCDMREFSNPEWFTKYADSTWVFFLGNLESFAADLAGNHTNHTDVQSYTQKRLNTTGAGMSHLLIEFCHNLFLPSEVRDHPVVQQISLDAWKWSVYTNDLFSYSKEEDELRSHNVVKLLMESEGLSLPEAAWRTVDMTNAIAAEIMERETQLPTSQVAQEYVRRLKEVMSGKLYWYSLQKRYRHPKAPFPELRDVDNASFFPKV